MIENRPWLTIFSHTMLILGIAVILFPLYVAFVAATLDKQEVYAAPMTLIPGTHLLENIHNIWVNGVGTNSAPFWRMLLNSFVMAFSITLGKITVSMLSAFAIVWFRFPLRNLFFWMIFITLMLPVEVRIFDGGSHRQPENARQLRRFNAAADGLGDRHVSVSPVLYDPTG